MKKTYGYIRVSTNQQVETGMSLKEQERQIRSYSDLKNLKCDKIFTERGVSASVELPKRPCGSELCLGEQRTCYDRAATNSRLFQ